MTASTHEDGARDAPAAPAAMRPPPRLTNHAGGPRHVGVELEFAEVSAHDAAHLVRSVFGGDVRMLDAHRYAIEGTFAGDFESELDSQLAHPKPHDPDTPVEAKLREWFGNVQSIMLPVEIVSPPLLLEHLPRMDSVVAALRRAGASDTRGDLLYAFGLQLNPEIAERSAAYLLSMLRAYMVLSERLRREIDIDVTRRLLAFAEPFPDDYALLVCDPGYAPDMPALIDDYLVFNPTRNRELDLLPLFAWIDEGRVREVVDDPLVKARPTFHWRLPNARFNDDGWTIVGEWNRWVEVEWLADAPERLADASAALRNGLEPESPLDRLRELRRWLDR